jgi:hypothetical protein
MSRNPQTQFDGPGFDQIPPAKALMTLRIIWFALLMGQVMFFLVLELVLLPQRQPPEHPNKLLPLVSVVMLLSVVPVTFIVRTVILSRARGEDGAVPLPVYATGNILFWAGCEGVSMFALVVMLLNVSIWPTIVVAGIAVALQVLTFPTGAGTRPAFDAFNK